MNPAHESGPVCAGNAASASATSLPSKLLNILASPSEVFSEIADGPAKATNWLVPTLLASASGILLVRTSSRGASGGSLIVAGAGIVLGTVWSGLLLWFIGRVVLNARFSMLKALEVAGLTGIIPVLGAVVTNLMMVVTDDETARPALSLFCGALPQGSHVPVLLEALNFFHLWAAAVLSIGLARLASVSFKEAAFWVFGYWVFIRIALVLLS